MDALRTVPSFGSKYRVHTFALPSLQRPILARRLFCRVMNRSVAPDGSHCVRLARSLFSNANVLHFASGVAPDLEPGADYVRALRDNDRERQTRLETRRRA